MGDARVRAWFCPEHGDALSHRVAKAIGKARERVRIASPVLSSGPILGTLVEVVNEKRCSVAGVIDDTQVDEVFEQWRTNGVSAWKIPLLRQILVGAEFSGKTSTPWSPTAVHDYMHAKVVVADDTVFVGSFNFSRSGERNAENVLEIREAALADRLAAFVDSDPARATRPRRCPRRLRSPLLRPPRDSAARARLHRARRRNRRRRRGLRGIVRPGGGHLEAVPVRVADESRVVARVVRALASGAVESRPPAAIARGLGDRRTTSSASVRNADAVLVGTGVRLPRSRVAVEAALDRANTLRVAVERR